MRRTLSTTHATTIPMNYMKQTTTASSSVDTSCNGILTHCKSVDEFVKLSLVKSYCLPLLFYCIGALNITGQQLQELAVCWNDRYCRIFGFKRHELVKLLQPTNADHLI